MLVQHLVKAANLLDATGSEPARQVSEGIDAVLASLSVSAGGDAHADMLKAAHYLASAAAAVAHSDAGMAKAIHTMIGQVQKLIGWIQEDTTQESANPFDTTEVKTDPDVNLGFGPEDRTEPGTDPSMWMPKPSITSSPVILERLLKVADLFDIEGNVEAAAILDVVIKDAMELPTFPSLMSTREELYDAASHNKMVMLPTTKREVEENTKNHHLLTMRDHPVSLSTRYPPDFPGGQMLPVAPGVMQDITTKKIYDYNLGWTASDGTKYPGGSVKNQTQNLNQIVNPTRLFDTKVPVEKPHT